MNRLTAVIRRLFIRKSEAAVEFCPPQRRLLRVHASTMRDLRRAIAWRRDRVEPLALLLVRFVSEDNRDVLVGVGLLEFPAVAYVQGEDGANFSVSWLMSALDSVAASNAGALICHEHAHQGKPEFSGVDRRTNEKIMAKQRLINDFLPYGAMVVSRNDAQAVVACAGGLRDFEVRLAAAYPEAVRR